MQKIVNCPFFTLNVYRLLKLNTQCDIIPHKVVKKVLKTHYETRKEQMNMTYIDYINYFWRMDEALGFSAVEAKLFLKLLDIVNKLHWKEDCLMIPMKRLMVAMDCSKNTILKARKRLIECGLIAVKPGNKNKSAACHRIICD